jgi:hypothetical protein
MEELLSDLRRRSASSSKRGSKSVSRPGLFFEMVVEVVEAAEIGDGDI